VPFRHVRVIVLDLIGVRPPDLVVGRGEHLPQLGAGDGASDGDVDVRGESFLRFDDREVLQVVAEVAAQVLDQPVEERGEVDGVASGALVVVPGCVARCVAGRVRLGVAWLIGGGGRAGSA
jgi:hypothetical protein